MQLLKKLIKPIVSIKYSLFVLERMFRHKIIAILGQGQKLFAVVWLKVHVILVQDFFLILPLQHYILAVIWKVISANVFLFVEILPFMQEHNNVLMCLLTIILSFLECLTIFLTKNWTHLLVCNQGLVLFRGIRMMELVLLPCKQSLSFRH